MQPVPPCWKIVNALFNRMPSAHVRIAIAAAILLNNGIVIAAARPAAGQQNQLFVESRQRVLESIHNLNGWMAAETENYIKV